MLRNTLLLMVMISSVPRTLGSFGGISGTWVAVAQSTIWPGGWGHGDAFGLGVCDGFSGTACAARLRIRISGKNETSQLARIRCMAQD
jgi:hypothetical protein